MFITGSPRPPRPPKAREAGHQEATCAVGLSHPELRKPQSFVISCKQIYPIFVPEAKTLSLQYQTADKSVLYATGKLQLYLPSLFLYKCPSKDNSGQKATSTYAPKRPMDFNTRQESTFCLPTRVKIVKQYILENLGALILFYFGIQNLNY